MCASFHCFPERATQLLKMNSFIRSPLNDSPPCPGRSRVGSIHGNSPSAELCGIVGLEVESGEESMAETFKLLWECLQYQTSAVDSEESHPKAN